MHHAGFAEYEAFALHWSSISFHLSFGLKAAGFAVLCMVGLVGLAAPSYASLN